jgi:hypothetical protein
MAGNCAHRFWWRRGCCWNSASPPAHEPRRPLEAERYLVLAR